METYFVNCPSQAYSGTTYSRHWLPLSLLNSIAILRREKISAKLISAKEAEDLSAKGNLRFFISTTPLDLWQCPPLSISQDFLQLCKNISSQNDLYILGYHGTLLPEFILQETGARAIIRKEPEETVLQICSGNSLEQIQGIAFKEDGKVIANSDRPPCDLTSFPVPAYDQIDFRDYSYELMGWEKFALFETSRGCQHNCHFCAKDLMYGRGLRRKTISQVQDELKNAIVEHGVKTGYFFDLDFLSNQQMSSKICAYLAAAAFDFKWCCQTRIDQVNEENLKWMAKAGCRLIHYGIETYQDIQGELKYKSFDVARLRAMIRLTKSFKIKTMCFYMIGLKGNYLSQQDRRTLWLMHRVNSSYASLHRYRNFNDGDFVKAQLCREGKNKKDKIDRAVFIHLLIYYLNPVRWIGFLMLGEKNKLWQRILFFCRTILRRCQ